jgi:hypothetical protein
MKKPDLFKTLCLILGIIFLASVLTVESHAHEKGSLGAKCPTVIESTLELAVGGCDANADELFTAVDFLRLPPEIVVVGKPITSSFLYRGPPLIAR